MSFYTHQSYLMEFIKTLLISNYELIKKTIEKKTHPPLPFNFVCNWHSKKSLLKKSSYTLFWVLLKYQLNP